MSKKDIVTNPETAEVEAVATHTDGEVCANLIKKEDKYFVVELDGTEKECGFTKDGYIALPANASNRKFIKINVAEKALSEASEMPLTYKATRTIGSTGPKLPNEKLISYLPEAEQEEYRAIIARAIAARDAEKNRPLTELEKAEKAYAAAQARIAKIQAELDALKNGATEA